MHSSFTFLSCAAVLLLAFPSTLLAQTKKPPLTTEIQQLFKEREQLYAQARRLMFQDRKYSEGMAKFQELLSIEKKLFGSFNSKIVSRLKQIADYYEQLTHWKEARESLSEVANILIHNHGNDHWKVQDAQQAVKDLDIQQRLKPEQRKLLQEAISLNGQVIKLWRNGQSAKAVPLVNRVIEIRRSLLGTKHPHYAIALNNLALLYSSLGESDKALPLYKQIITLRKELSGEKHPNYAIALNNLAQLYYSRGEYGKALPLYQQALKLKKIVLGVKDPSYVNTLNNLASLYHSQGAYSKALPLFQQALNLGKEVLGEKHPLYATSLNNLAGLYASQGAYGRALILYQQALNLRKEILGEKHPDYAGTLNNLAGLYESQGEYGKALPLYQQALTLRKEVQGEKHPEYAQALNNLAFQYMTQGEYDKALPLYLQAIILFKRLLGEKHPDYANYLNNLAGLYESQGKYGKALPLHQKVLKLRKEILGEKHPDYAQSLNNLALVYYYQDEHDKALPLFQQVLALRKAALGEMHPEYVSTLNSLAQLYFVQEKYYQAETNYRQGAKAFLKHRALVSHTGLQRAGHTSQHSRLSAFVSVLARNDKPKEAWHWLEQSLGRATWDEITARNNRTAQEQQRLDQIQGRIRQLNQLLRKLASQNSLSQNQQQLQKQWLIEQGQLYTKLVDLHKQLEAKYGILEGISYSLKQIQSALKDDTAFLTWVDWEGEHWAILLRSQGEPIFRRTQEESGLPDRVYQSLQTTQRANSKSWVSLLQRLRKQRIDPIENNLKNIQQIIVLPSPLMDKIPMELLLPEKRVSKAPSATLYTWLQQRAEPKGTKLLTLGDPIYNPQEELKENPLPESGILINTVIVNSTADKAGLKTEDVLLEYQGTALDGIDDLHKAMSATKGQEQVRIKVWREGRSFEKAIPAGSLGVVLSKVPAKVALKNRRNQHWQLVSRGDHWQALPGSRVEVATIAKLVKKRQCKVFLDTAASERNLHQLATTDKLKEYKYLHFATHGQVNDLLPMESALILSQHDLKVNLAELKTHAAYLDGRLTAKEVALYWQLDADLVTLSACKSGLGKHAKGEGYMGFAQSFLIRGARSVVLSLWSVDDTATALLMSRFYENLIKRSMSKIDALREAKKWLRTLPRSDALKLTAKMSNGVARGPGRKKLPSLHKVPMTEKKEDAPYAHPYYWSAFILIGDPH